MSESYKWRIRIKDKTYRLKDDSTDALFELIKQRINLDRETAEGILMSGKLLVCQDLIVAHEETMALIEIETRKGRRRKVGL